MNRDMRKAAIRLAMQAGSWFDRTDLPLTKREAAVAALILRELGRVARKAVRS